MFNQLQKEHCLYSISEAQLNQFKQLTEKYDFHYDYKQKPYVSEFDYNCTILHVWSSINEQNLNITFDQNKTMLYSSNYYILSLVQSNREIKSFIEIYNKIEDLHFILSYFLTKSLIDWCSLVLTENNLQNQYSFEYMQNDYFNLHEERDILYNPHHPIYAFQKKLITAFAKDFHQNTRFNEYISTAIGMTIAYLKLKDLEPLHL